MKLICDKCKYEIATINTKDIKVPLSGAMFSSKDEGHGFPPPWSPVVPWKYMFCPMCQKIPFMDPAGGFLMDDSDGVLVLTDEGVHVIDKDGIFSTEDDNAEESEDMDSQSAAAPDSEKGNKEVHTEPTENGAGQVKDDDQPVESNEAAPGTPESSEVTASDVDAAPETTGVAEGGTPEAEEAAPDAEADTQAASASEAEGEPSEAAPAPTPESIFARLLQGGEIIQNGSWFEYQGKNYRKDELLKMIAG